MSIASATASALSVSLRGVGRAFPGIGKNSAARIILREIDLEIAPGEIVALLGPSGCGKSTLLRQVSGLDIPDAGSVLIDGIPVEGIDERSSIGFQEPRLLPWRTIERNVALGLPRETGKAAGRDRVAQLLELVQLSDAATLRPRQVSGGMAQRASLARALARRPGVLVLDEPFGALDALTRLTMQDLLVDLHAAEPVTVVLVTHDVDEALYLADRVVLLGGEPGHPGATIRRVVEVAKPRPRDRADAGITALRGELLAALGVEIHHTPSTHSNHED